MDRLVSDLAAHGIPVWYDKLEVRLGDSIPGKINSGISEAKYFLIGMYRRTDVVDEAGQRQFRRARAAADRVASLAHEHGAPGALRQSLRPSHSAPTRR